MCERSYISKYASRPSPPYPAQKCASKLFVGNDGGWWLSSPTSAGIYRWIKQKDTSVRKVLLAQQAARKAAKKKATSKSPKKATSKSPKKATKKSPSKKSPKKATKKKSKRSARR